MATMEAAGVAAVAAVVVTAEVVTLAVVAARAVSKYKKPNHINILKSLF